MAKKEKTQKAGKGKVEKKETPEECAERVATQADAAEAAQKEEEEAPKEEEAPTQDLSEEVAIEELIAASEQLTELMGLEPPLYKEGMTPEVLVKRTMGAVKKYLTVEEIPFLTDETKAVLTALGWKGPEVRTSGPKGKVKVEKTPKAPKPPKISRLESAVEAWFTNKELEKDLDAWAKAAGEVFDPQKINEKEAKDDCRRALRVIEALRVRGLLE